MVHPLPLCSPTATPSFPSFSIMVTITLQRMGNVPILKREKLRDHLPLPNHWTIPSNTSWSISSLESGGSAYLLCVCLYFSFFLQRTPWIHPTWFISFQEGGEGNCRIDAYSRIARKGGHNPRVDLALGASHPDKHCKRLICKPKMTI